MTNGEKQTLARAILESKKKIWDNKLLACIAGSLHWVKSFGERATAASNRQPLPPYSSRGFTTMSFDPMQPKLANYIFFIDTVHTV